ncbi:hypothetical protein M8C21_013144, partial [Ambrosia artemisiifolia]
IVSGLYFLFIEDEHLGFISTTSHTRKTAATHLYAVEIGSLLGFFMLTNQPKSSFIMDFVVNVVDYFKIALEELKKPPRVLVSKFLEFVDLEMCMKEKALTLSSDS